VRDYFEGSVMKAGREHRVPLSDAALGIVKKRIEAGGAYIFAGGRKRKPLSNMAMLKVLERHRACPAIIPLGIRRGPLRQVLPEFVAGVCEA
jgi:integrase